jgi:hypothetical protein
MAQFDPDAYLASKRVAPPPAFDPNAFLASKRAAPPPGMRAVQPGEIPTESGFYSEPPEEPRRTFGQRVLGAAAAPLDIAATLASGAGRAAATLPYALVTGRGIEPSFRELQAGVRQPQTPEGRAALEAVAPALSALPPVIGTAPAVAGVAGPGARQAGRMVAQEAELAAQPIIAARAAQRERTALQRSAADWQRAPQIEAANRAVELEIALNPAQSNPTLGNRARSTLAGNRDVNAILVKQNAPKWTELAKRDMGLNIQTPLNASAFEEARRAVSGPYDQMRRMGVMSADDSIRSQLDNLRVEQAAIGGELGAKRVNKLVDEAQKKVGRGLDGAQLLDSIRQLRRDAQAIRNAQKVGQAPSPERIAEADAKLQIANVLENMAENNIFDPKFKQEFRQSRAALAKTYAYEDATDFNTGQVDPLAIARLTQGDNALTGIIADIGAIAGNFPEIASSATPSTLLQRAGTTLTRSGVGGTIGAGLGAITVGDPIAGGVAGAAAGGLLTGLQTKRMLTPEYQRRFAAPQDRRIFPTQEQPPANALVPYVAPQTVLTPQQGAFVTGTKPQMLRRTAEGAFVPPTPPGGPQQAPSARFVGPQAGPQALPAPSAEATMGTLRAEDARRAGVSRAIGQEAEAQQAAAEAAARRPAAREVMLEIDPVSGRLREASQGIKGATPETFSNYGSSLASAATKVTEGKKFDLTAAEKVAWERTKVDLAEVAPGMKALTDKAIAEKMMDRQWVADAVRKAREKADGFARIEASAKDAQARRQAEANKERMLDLLEALEEKFRAPRPDVSMAQGPKTRAAKAAANPGQVNNLAQPSVNNLSK